MNMDTNTLAELFSPGTMSAGDYLLAALIAGYMLDLVLGDPRWLPHPIVGFGRVIAAAEKQLNRGRFRFAKGAAAGIILPVTVFALLYGAESYVCRYSMGGFAVFSAVGLFFGIANRTLVREGAAVLRALETEGLDAGRKRLSWIVGRETSQLSRQQIFSAVFETMSENLSDGVVAPLFFYALAGVPGILTYKMINTLDSMIGYKSERYRQFGCFSARLDDVANFIPARLTALLMVAVTLSWRGAVSVRTYARHHASPNSGYPESALAGILGCRFGGPNMYHGQLVEKPYIGDTARELEMADFAKVCYINHAVTLAMVAAIATGYLLLL